MNYKKKYWKEMIFIQGWFQNIVTKSNDWNKVIIKGYVSTEDLDRWKEIVLKTAFDSSIDEYFKTNPQMLYQHNHDKSVWKFIDYEIDQKWVNMTWEVLNNIDIDWVDLFQRLNNWTLKTFSIWFRVKEMDFHLDWKLIASLKKDEIYIWDWVTDEQFFNNRVIRTIKDLELLEVSLVNIPMNWNATFKVIKNLSQKSFEKSLEINRNFYLDQLSKKYEEWKNEGDHVEDNNDNDATSVLISDLTNTDSSNKDICNTNIVDCNEWGIEEDKEEKSIDNILDKLTDEEMKELIKETVKEYIEQTKSFTVWEEVKEEQWHGTENDSEMNHSENEGEGQETKDVEEKEEEKEEIIEEETKEEVVSKKSFDDLEKKYSDLEKQFNSFVKKLEETPVNSKIVKTKEKEVEEKTEKDYSFEKMFSN